jgi:hypothetical protein
VYVEFLISFIPVFLLFLGIVQLAFIASAKLVVQHAAITGARSAAVVLEDDHDDYRGEGFGVIDYRGSSDRRSSFQAKLNTVMKWFGADESALSYNPFYNRGGPRLRDIRFAVYLPLLAISPSVEQVTGWFGIDRDPYDWRSKTKDSLQKAIGRHPELRFVAGLLYNRAAAAVTFPAAPGSKSFIQGALGPHDTVTLRVTYLYPCVVPLVSSFMCNSLLDLSGLSRSMGKIRRAIENADLSDIEGLHQEFRNITNDARARASRYAQTIKELSHAEMPGMLLPLLLTSTRFVVLRAEASMLIQGADYYRQ